MQIASPYVNLASDGNIGLQMYLLSVAFFLNLGFLGWAKPEIR
jgi:hypothetical protein